jgi:arabinogalactan oligomer/maltooligosaccharide transport system permease protein
LLAPALAPAVVIGSVWTFNMFNVIYLVSGGEPDGATEILITEAYRWAFTRQEQYGYAAAYAVLIFGVLAAYTRLFRRFLYGGKALA